MTVTEPKTAGLPSGRAAWVAWAGVLAATLVVFARALGGELVYDDLLMVGQNPDITSLGNIPRFFSRPYWAFLGPETDVGFWRPLTATGLALGHALGKGDPWGFHAVSLLAHALAATGAFLLALRLSARTSVAFFAALLFALHPLQVEGVAWITALNDPLYVACSLFALWAWVGWRRSGSSGVPWAAVLWLVPALLAKETALVILPLVFLFDLVHERSGGTITRRSNVLGYGSLGLCLVAWVAARCAVFASPWAGFDLTTTDLGVGVGRLALLRLELYGGALELFAWPFSLTLFRPFRPTVAPTDTALFVAAASTLVFVVLLVVAWRRRAHRAFFALAFVPAALSVMLVRIESLGIFPLSDRFLALAVFGPSLLLALVLVGRGRRGGAVVLLALAVAWGAASFQRIGAWRDEETLFRDAAAKAPRSPYAHWGLGRVLLDRYVETDDPDYLNEAERTFVTAQDLLVESRAADTDVLAGPTDFLQTNLGYGWARLFQDERSGYEGSSVALGIFEELAERIAVIEERHVEARSLGINVREPHLEVELVYTAIGVARMRLGMLEEAESALRRAIEHNPRYPEAHVNLGELYSRLGEWELAARHVTRAAELRPGNPMNALLVAKVSAQLGDLDRAAELALPLALEGRHPEAPIVLAEIAVARGDAAEARRWTDEVLARDEENARAWYLRGQAFLLASEAEQATGSLRRAAELAPDDFDPAYDLGVLLMRLGRVDAALPELVRAYGLCRDEELLSALRQAIAQLPHSSPEPLVRLAILDARRLDNAAALAWLDLALAQAPEHPEALLQKARLLRREERHAEAVSLMRRACELLPDSFPAHTELGSYLKELGLATEAVRILRRARAIGAPADWPPELANEALAELERRLGELGGL